MRRSAVLALLILLAAASARASKCPPPSLARELAAADVVFLGRALRAVDDGDTTFAVERVFKGEAPAEVLARFHGNKYARLSAPGRYLVFGVLDAGHTELTVRDCSGSGPAEALEPKLRRLGPGRPPGAALVSGKPPRPRRNACLERCRRENMSRDCADEDGGLAPCPCHCP